MLRLRNSRCGSAAASASPAAEPSMGPQRASTSSEPAMFTTSRYVVESSERASFICCRSAGVGMKRRSESAMRRLSEAALAAGRRLSERTCDMSWCMSSIR